MFLYLHDYGNSICALTHCQLGAFNMMHSLDIIAIVIGTIFLFGAWGCDLGISINDEEQMTKLADKCFKTIIVELIIYILIVWWVMPYVFSS